MGIILCHNADGLPELIGPAVGVDLKHFWLTEPVGDGEIVSGGIGSLQSIFKDASKAQADEAIPAPDKKRIAYTRSYTS